jgi:antitoxin VapB
MATARIFKSGNGHAVQLPASFRLRGEEVEIFRRGNEIILREKAPSLAHAFELLADLPDDFLAEDRHDGPPQVRKPVR